MYCIFTSNVQKRGRRWGVSNALNKHRYNKDGKCTCRCTTKPSHNISKISPAANIINKIRRSKLVSSVGQNTKKKARFRRV